MGWEWQTVSESGCWLSMCKCLHWSSAAHTHDNSFISLPSPFLPLLCPQGDVFSFGMTLSELITFHPPFCGGPGGHKPPNELTEKIRNGERPRLSLKVGTQTWPDVTGCNGEHTNEAWQSVVFFH